MANTKNILDEIVAHKQKEIRFLESNYSLTNLQKEVKLASGCFLKNIQQPGTNLIVEIKPKSPSAGLLKENLDLSYFVDICLRHGRAISVLTDEKFFGGSFELFGAVAKRTSQPLLCKDFILSKDQCYLARQMGAEAVLLIVKILSASQLQCLYETILSLGMLPIVEVQSVMEVEQALAIKPECILINNRNLETLIVDIENTVQLSQLIPNMVTIVSASGLESRNDIEYLSKHCQAFLVGSAFMRSADPEKFLAELVGGNSKQGNAK